MTDIAIGLIEADRSDATIARTHRAVADLADEASP